MKRKKTFFFLSCIVLLSICAGNFYGKTLKISAVWGQDLLLLPRELAVIGDEIILLDEYFDNSRGGKIAVFSLDGKLKMSFGSTGEGPGEYGEARCFYIFDKRIYILDSIRQRVHLFSLQDKRFLESFKIYFCAPGTSYTTPDDFLMASADTLYYNAGRMLEGQKLISCLVKVPGAREFKPQGEFLDCFPLFKDENSAYSTPEQVMNRPDNVRKSNSNDGYIAISGNKIYFCYTLLNTLYEFSLDGKVLNRYNLPMESIDKTVKVIKLNSNYSYVERHLNYDIMCREGSIYVLSRDVNGDSVIFRLENGKFSELYRVKEELFAVDFSSTKLYGIEREKAQLLVYDLSQ
jgi:hypothetical protein